MFCYYESEIFEPIIITHQLSFSGSRYMSFVY